MSKPTNHTVWAWPNWSNWAVRALPVSLLLALGCRAATTPATATATATVPVTEESASMSDPAPLFPALVTYLDALAPELDALPAERLDVLAQLADYIQARHAAGQPARLLFICTHNSRRSHMGQLWAATAAAYYGVDGIESFSGGTEATAFNPRAVAAMQRAGFDIHAPDGEQANPRYEVRFGAQLPAQIAFSKTWQDPINPSEGFAAVMTCSQADEACPLVRGATLRVSLPYDDPKQADGTDEESARYDERARQIATEMLALFRLVAAADHQP